MTSVTLSVVTTLYRSSAYLVEFHKRVSAAARHVTPDYEIILVNDGSPDDSQAIASRLCDEDPRVSLVELSRNFGHHKAIMTGLGLARGERVFLIDSDLEEEPEVLSRFVDLMAATSADVVYGVQEKRRGRFFNRMAGELFYRLFNWMSPHRIPRNPATARLMVRRYVRGLVAHRDREVFLAGLWAMTGFKQVPAGILKHSLSPTTYNFRRKVAGVVNAVTSFSTAPLVAIFYLGLFMSVVSAIGGIALIIRVLFFGGFLVGWASLIVSIWFLGGLSIFSLGVIGIYLSKIFSETKDRPYTVIRSVQGPLAEADHDAV